jgi:hypothetical protein
MKQLNLAAKIYLRSLLEKILYKHISRSYKGYDIVISYQEGGTTYFTQHIESPHRIAWIHCDYAKYYELHTLEYSSISIQSFIKLDT